MPLTPVKVNEMPDVRSSMSATGAAEVKPARAERTMMALVNCILMIGKSGKVFFLWKCFDSEEDVVERSDLWSVSSKEG